MFFFRAYELLQQLDDLRNLESSDLAQAFIEDPFIGTSFIRAYSHCQSLADARRVFDAMPEKNVVAWNAMLKVYSQHNQGEEALRLFEAMQEQGGVPDAITFNSVLSLCTELGWIEEGDEVYKKAVEQYGVVPDTILNNTLITMYGKSGRLDEAKKVFEEMRGKNADNSVTWASMMNAYNRNNEGKEALRLFEEMQKRPREVTEAALRTALTSCASVGGEEGLEWGEKIHRVIKESRVGRQSSVVAVGLINMYAKCGRIEKARKVFEDAIKSHNHHRLRVDANLWSILMREYDSLNRPMEVLELFKRMRQQKDIEPNKFTLSLALSACAEIGSALDLGRQIHQYIIEKGMLNNDDSEVLSGALITMYWYGTINTFTFILIC